MTRTRSSSAAAALALALVEELQGRFKTRLEALARARGPAEPFAAIEWLRDEGRHGGGMRYVAAETAVFNRVAINVSHVHYADVPDKRLDSATALSTIIHPAHPRAPSVHMHISWTEMKDGAGYWRMMADLNPALADEEARERFAAALREAAPEVYEEARVQGDDYFYIPALGRHRGVTHFYLEAYASGDHDADRALARRVGETGIDTYVDILDAALAHAGPPSEADRAAQLTYHTLYLFQVLTLDRGTTSGLLIHDQNELGVMGSLPAHVDRERLAAWEARVPELQKPLVRALAEALPEGSPSHVDDASRVRLARIVRDHYRAHPQALELLASAKVVPPTVDNHSAR